MGLEGKYGKVHTEKGNIPEKEPLFILRAQDLLAPDAVRMYAALRRARGDEEGATACESQANRMCAWPKRKYPD